MASNDSLTPAQEEEEEETSTVSGESTEYEEEPADETGTEEGESTEDDGDDEEDREGDGGDDGEPKEKEKVEEQVGESAGLAEKLVPSCPVCMETWTSEGPHRVCCIPCGHVYGKSCLEKWLKWCGNRVAKCPQCNSIFKPTNIINLYALRIPVPDDVLQNGSETEQIAALKSQIANLTSLLRNQQEMFKEQDARQHYELLMKGHSHLVEIKREHVEKLRTYLKVGSGSGSGTQQAPVNDPENIPAFQFDPFFQTGTLDQATRSFFSHQTYMAQVTLDEQRAFQDVQRNCWDSIQNQINEYQNEFMNF